VCSSMVDHGSWPFKSLLTNIAFIEFVSGVCASMVDQAALVCKYFLTNNTFIRRVSRVCFFAFY
jgi:hypothetical protein